MGTVPVIKAKVGRANTTLLAAVGFLSEGGHLHRWPLPKINRQSNQGTKF